MNYHFLMNDFDKFWLDNETGPLMVFRIIQRTEGFPGFFRGLEAMLWRWVTIENALPIYRTHTVHLNLIEYCVFASSFILCLYSDAIPYGIFMFVYEYLIEKLRAPVLQRSFHYKEQSVENLRTAIAGACAGMLSWLPGIPFDVIKTKMMTATTPDQYRNVLHCFSVITKVISIRFLSLLYHSFFLLLFVPSMIGLFIALFLFLLAGTWIQILIPWRIGIAFTFCTNQCSIIYCIREYATILSKSSILWTIFMILFEYQSEHRWQRKRKEQS